MTDCGAWWSPASGRSRPSALGVEGLWDGLRRRASAVRGITRFDPSMFKSPHRGRGERLLRHRPHRGAAGPAARPLLPVHRRGHPHGAGRRRARPRPRGPRPRRRDDGHGARRRGARRGAVPQLPRRRARGRWIRRSRSRSSPGRPAATSPSSSGCTGPNSTNGMSCASGTIAIGEAFRAIAPGRRRRDARRRRRGAAGAALLRRVRHHPGDVHPQRRPGPRQPPVRSRPRRVRDGARARRCWCWRSASGRWPAAPRSTPRSAATASPTTRTT